MSRRTLAACCLALATLVVSVTTPSPVSAAPAQEADPNGTSAGDVGPTMEVLDQDLEIAANDTFQVTLRIRGAPLGSDLAVDIYDRIEDPAGFAASTTTQPSGSSDTFDPVPLATEGDPTQQDQAIALAIFGGGGPRPPSVNAYELDEPGVYPVRIRLRGPDGELLTSLVTYLVRKPTEGETVSSAHVALLTTVHQDAAITATEPGDGAGDGDTTAPGAGEADTSRAWRDDLDAVLAALAERAELPSSFVVTPETADRLAADPQAADTLTALQAEVGRPRRELVAAPYVDIDPAQLVDNGLSSEVLRQADLGTRALADALALPDPDDRPGQDTWVVDHRIDGATVDLLADLGITRLVLPTDATATGRVQARLPIPGADGRVEALSDSSVALATDTPDDPVLAGYQLLGRLAAIGSVTPGGTTSVLRIDPETVDADQLATVLDGLGASTSFLRPATLGEAFTDGPRSPTAVTLTEPAPADLGAYPGLVTETHDLLGSYGSMLIDRPDLVEAFERPLAVTAADDAELLVRRRALRDIKAELRSRLGAVSTPARERVTLGARDAQFPLAITSTRSEPVNVIITLEASNRLSFPDDTIEATLTGERTVVQIPVQTRATGDTPLRITVRTPDQRQILAESRYTVRSTAVSGVGILLTVGAGGFLALWWGRHWLRTRRSRHDRQPRPVELDDDDLFVDDPDPTVGEPGVTAGPAGRSEPG